MTVLTFETFDQLSFWMHLFDKFFNWKKKCENTTGCEGCELWPDLTKFLLDFHLEIGFAKIRQFCWMLHFFRKSAILIFFKIKSQNKGDFLQDPNPLILMCWRCHGTRIVAWWEPKVLWMTYNTEENGEETGIGGQLFATAAPRFWPPHNETRYRIVAWWQPSVVKMSSKEKTQSQRMALNAKPCCSSPTKE